MTMYFSDRAYCKACGLRKDCYTSSRYAGGNYRVAGRWYQSRICFDCAVDYAASVSPGHSSIHGWSASSLVYLVRNLYTPRLPRRSA